MEEQQQPIELPATATNGVTDQYGEQTIFTASCNRRRYTLDVWLSAIIAVLIGGWIMLAIALYIQIAGSVDSWYLYLTNLHINYSGPADPCGGACGTRTRRIALSDIQRIEANEYVGCTIFPICGICYFPSSANTVVVWLKPEKRAEYGRSCCRDCVEIRYVLNPAEFVSAVQKQISTLPQE